MATRRGFLQMLGGAVTAPLMPSATLGAAAKAAYPASALHAAIYHAQSDLLFSCYTLAKRLGLSIDQTTELMSDMSARGIIGPIKGTTRTGAWARSQVWIRPRGSVVASARTVASSKPSPSKAISDTYRETTEATDEQSVQLNAQDCSKEVSTSKESKMEKFEKLTGIAAPMPLVNIDTDMIIPKVFLKTIKRSGLGVNLFDEMRYDRDGNEIEDFVLNKPAYRGAQILVAGDNFGCGSSREHAPWALADFGIKCVISTSFADIFFNNCFKNGILPIVLPQEDVDKLMDDAERGANAVVTVDLENQTITGPDGGEIKFSVDAHKKHCLLNGLDDIGQTMEKASAIDAYEAKTASTRPWV